MTDEEIVKALEDCHSGNGNACPKCIYRELETATETYCIDAIHRDTLDLINRQKAEIERLKDKVFSRPKTVPKLIKQIKAEAVKEFAEVVKAGLFEKCCINYTECCEVRRYIDSLVEEMAGSK